MDKVIDPGEIFIELDVSGLKCPLPLLRAKVELRRLSPGDILKVIATDAASQRDFQSFARLAGHEMVRQEADEGIYRYWLRKGDNDKS